MFWMLNNAVVGIGIVQRWIFAISKTRWLVKVISVFGIQATASQPTGSSLLRRLAEIRLEIKVDWLDSFYSKVTSEKTEHGIGARTAVIRCRCSENVTFQFLPLVWRLQAPSLAVLSCQLSANTEDTPQQARRTPDVFISFLGTVGSLMIWGEINCSPKSNFKFKVFLPPFLWTAQHRCIDSCPLLQLISHISLHLLKWTSLSIQAKKEMWKLI